MIFNPMQFSHRWAKPWIPDILLVGVALLLGFTIRVVNFDGHGLWLDEAATYLQVFEGDFGSTADPVLYPAILRFLSDVTHWYSVDALRFFTLLMGAMLPLTCYVAGKVMVGRMFAFYCALVGALHPFAVVFSQQVRPYALFMTFVPLFIAVTSQYLRYRNRALSLAVAVLALSSAHLLSSQLMVGFALAFLISIIDSWHSRVLGVKSLFRWVGLTAVCTIPAGLAGVYWLAPRWEKISRTTAILGSYESNSLSHGEYLAGLLPLGSWHPPANIPAFVCIGIGCWYFRKKHPQAVVFGLCATITILAMNYATIGHRVDWGYLAGRYYSHLFVIAIFGIAGGVVAVHDWVAARWSHSPRLAPVIGILLLLVVTGLGYTPVQTTELSDDRYANASRARSDAMREEGIDYLVVARWTESGVLPLRPVLNHLVWEGESGTQILSINSAGQVLRHWHDRLLSPPKLKSQPMALRFGKVAVLAEKGCALLQPVAGRAFIVTLRRHGWFSLCSLSDNGTLARPGIMP